MEKVELMAQITNAHNNWFLGLAGVAALSRDDVVSLLEKDHAQFGELRADFSQLKNFLNNACDRDIALKEFLLSHFRALIKETFELIKTYCKTTNQFSTFENASIYNFSRIIRNAVSHSFRFQMSERDKKNLPYNWRGRIISIELDGKFLSIDFLGYDGMLQLHRDLEKFAQDQLN